MENPGLKHCARCGREMQYRKKWRKNWQYVKYCSQKCRTQKLQPIDFSLEQAILQLLRMRKGGATICPSEVARASTTEKQTDWRSLMEPTRMAARRLVNKNQIEITQRGRVVNPSFASGPIRLRLVDNAR